MTPYEDADLAALVLGRGLLDEERLRRAARLCSSAAPRSGALARALVETGALDRRTVDAALAELQRFVVACEGCARRFCALPGDRPRRVACPACGRPRDVAPHVQIPPTSVPRARSTGRRGPRAPGADEATLPLPGSEAARRASQAARGPGSEAGREATMALRGSDHPPGGRGSGRVAVSGGGTLPLPGSDAGARAASGGLAPRSEDGGILPGERVGPYEVEREISRGAMGVVLRARHLEVEDRVVAIKVMAADLEQDPDGLRRFQREGEVLASMDHPNVVRVFDAGRLPDGRPYLAMDYVEGTTLEHLARERGPLPVEEAARLLEVVARGVAYMNVRGVVHRDLKLGNVLVDARGSPRIADFGLAHVAGAVTRITQQGDLLGTPLYMAPEVVRGDPGVDGRIDVYSLGVMLFRLVTGSYPFYADNSVALFDLVLHAQVTYPPDLGADARAVLERALARHRDLRYPDADALADDLAALAAGRPVSARPITRGERLARSLRSPGRVALVAAVLVAGLLVTGGVWVVRRWPVWRAQRALVGLSEAMTRERAAVLAGAPDGAARELLQRAEQVLRATPAADPSSWRDAGELLARAADGGDEAAARALALVGDERVALARALERRELAERVAALRAGTDPGPPEGLRALLERARALRPDGAAAEAPAAFERATAWLHLSCGELEAARAALERAAAAGGGDAALAAWTRLRSGEAGALDDAFAPLERAALALVAFGLRGEAALLEGARRDLAAAPAGPARDLLGARLAWAADPARGEAARGLEHLAAARAVSDRAPGSVADALRGRAALLEGEVLLGLGWWASAARAFEVAASLLDGEPFPPGVVELDGAPALLAPRAAAHLLRARCLARGLDGEAALAAADAAVAWARLEPTPAALVEALALRAEAHALLGREALASEDLSAARALGPAADLGALARVEARVALWRDGAARGPLPGADAGRARAALAAAEGTLRAAFPVDPSKAPEVEAISPEGCARAARGFALAAALATDARGQAGAWAGLARARLFAGDTDAAALAAERAVRADPAARETAHARALVRGVRGADAAVDALVQDLEARATDPSVRPVPRAGGLLAATCEAAWALRQSPGAQAAVVDAAEALLAAERASPALRERLLLAGLRLASRANARERLDALEARLQALRRSVGEDVALAREARTGVDGTFVARTEAAVTALKAMLERYPMDPIWYEELYARGEELKPWGFDCLTIAFEVRPGLIPQRANAQRQRNDEDEVARSVTMEAMPRILVSEDAASNLPFRRDDDLRRAAVVMFMRELGVPVTTADALAAAAAAERFVERQPGSMSGWLALGYLRLDLGDAGGALEALDRAAAMNSPLEVPRKTDACWAHFYTALAYGAQRRWDEALLAIKRAAEAGLWYAERLRDPRLSEDRSPAIRPDLAAFADKLRANDTPRRPATPGGGTGR